MCMYAVFLTRDELATYLLSVQGRCVGEKSTNNKCHMAECHVTILVLLVTFR